MLMKELQFHSQKAQNVPNPFEYSEGLWGLPETVDSSHTKSR